MYFWFPKSWLHCSHCTLISPWVECWLHSFVLFAWAQFKNSLDAMFMFHIVRLACSHYIYFLLVWHFECRLYTSFEAYGGSGYFGPPVRSMHPRDEYPHLANTKRSREDAWGSEFCCGWFVRNVCQRKYGQVILCCQNSHATGRCPDRLERFFRFPILASSYKFYIAIIFKNRIIMFKQCAELGCFVGSMMCLPAAVCWASSVIGCGAAFVSLSRLCVVLWVSWDAFVKHSRC